MGRGALGGGERSLAWQGRGLSGVCSSCRAPSPHTPEYAVPPHPHTGIFHSHFLDKCLTNGLRSNPATCRNGLITKLLGNIAVGITGGEMEISKDPCVMSGSGRQRQVWPERTDPAPATPLHAPGAAQACWVLSETPVCVLGMWVCVVSKSALPISPFL